MTPPWGINWQCYHKDMNDFPHIERMGYRSFTTYEWMWSDRGFCADLLAVARPDAIFLDRDHPKSEEKDEQFRNDPAGKGRAHADDWAQKVHDGRVFTPLDRTFFLGLNEPNSNEFQRQIDAYNEAFCRRLAEHGLRAAAYSFGVGHPSTINLDPKLPPDWHWYEASANAILEGHHIAALHEYGAPEKNGYGWGYWCNRCQYCPYPFNAVLDECSIDNGVTGGELKGWAEFLTPIEYLAWLDGFQVGYAERASTRKVNLLAYNIFSYDHGRGESKDWHSWDIRPIRPQLEAFRWTEVTPPTVPDTTPPFTVHLPAISTDAKPAFVAVTAGANLRDVPRLDNSAVISAVPYGDQVTVTGYDANRTWAQVEYGGEQGWILASLLTFAPPTKPTLPSGDTWERVWPIVLDIEGGLSLDPNDPGNYYNGKLVGTKYGISAASWGGQYDIPNLTKEQALEIYRKAYFEASGASSLPWPMSLIVMDTAVNHGVGVARGILENKPTPEQSYLGQRALRYFSDPNWARYGVAWGNRVRRIQEEGGA